MTIVLLLICNIHIAYGETFFEVSSWNPPDDLCVNSAVITLDDLLISGATSGGVWTVNGVMTTVFDPSLEGPGSHQVTYAVGTPVDQTTHTINVVQLPSPITFCSSISVSSVTFSWVGLPGAVDYIVTPITAHTGTLMGMSYVVEGLVPGEQVTVAIQAVDANGCEGEIVELTCSAEECTDGFFSFDPVPTICASEDADTIMLSITPVTSNSTGIWSGEGIVSVEGLFVPNIDGQTTYTVYYRNHVGSCFHMDSLEIDVIALPSYELTYPDVFCLTDTIDVMINGDDLEEQNITWDFGEANIVSGSGLGPYELSWDTSGIQSIGVTVSEDICVSEQVFHDVQIDVPLDTPDFLCQSTFTTLEYTWNDIDFATAYIVNVLNASIGTPTSDTTYLIEGLVPGQEVTIQMNVVSNNACPGVIVLPACNTAYCPEIGLAIDPIDTICVDAGMQTVDLNYSADLSDSIAMEIVWQGVGVIDSIAGVLAVDSTMLGEQQLIAHMVIGDSTCFYSDTIMYEVITGPEIDFMFPSEVCTGDTSLLVATGDIWDENTYVWNGIETEEIIATNGDSLWVVWNTSGMRTIELEVTNSLCGQDIASETVVVSTPLLTPDITCESGYDNVLFTWPSVVGATSYQVVMLGQGSGVLLSDTSYMVNNLMVGDEAEIGLILMSDGVCGDVYTTANCMPSPCEEVSITIAPIADICFEQTVEVPLSIEIIGDTTDMILSWTGQGIVDGLWTVDSTMVGNNIELIVSLDKDICHYADTVVVAVLPTPIAAFDMADTICIDQEAQLIFTGQAGDDAIWHWTFGDGQDQGGLALMWDNAGTDEVSLYIEENGCFSDTVTQPIVIDPLTTPIAASCMSTVSSIELDWGILDHVDSVVVVTNPVVPFEWTATGLVINDLAPETTIEFTLTTITNSSCGGSMQMLSCTTDACEDISLSWSAPPAICLGDEANITFALTGVSALDIEMEINGAPTTINGVMDGTVLPYSLANTTTFSIVNIVNLESQFCLPQAPSDITIEVNETIIAGSAGNTAAYCLGAEALVNVEDLIVDFVAGGDWQEPSGLPSGAFDITTATVNIEMLPVGEYEFIYTILSPSPCPSSSITATIEIYEAVTSDAGMDIELTCNTPTITLGGSATTSGVSYQWSNSSGEIAGATATMLTTNEAGVYTLEVRNATTGCVATDEVIVTSSIEVVTVEATAQNDACYGSNNGWINIDTIYGGVAPYMIVFDGEGPSNQLLYSNLNPGEYLIEVEDNNGCTGELALDVMAPVELMVELLIGGEAVDNTIHIGEEVNLTAVTNVPISTIDTCIWTPSSIAVYDSYTAIDTPFVSTTYSVEIIDENGCTASDLVTIYVNKDDQIYIPNAFSPNDDGVNDRFMVMGGRDVARVKRLAIYDRWGAQMFAQDDFSANDPAMGWDGSFLGKQVNTGVYIYTAEVEMIDGRVVNVQGEITLLR